MVSCHELFASLGFDLMEVGSNSVTLRTGKHANKRTITFVLQAHLIRKKPQEMTTIIIETQSQVIQQVIQTLNHSFNYVLNNYFCVY
jgi:hypothetical protein